MDFYYDTQIRATAPRAATAGGTYSGPARQFGSGAAGLGALAVRVGRSTLPLLAKYALPVVKKVGRNLITAAIPELADVLRGKKKLKHAVKTSVKKGVSRSVSQALVNQQAAAMNYRNKVSAPAARAGAEKLKLARSPARRRVICRVRRRTQIKNFLLNWLSDHDIWQQPFPYQTRQQSVGLNIENFVSSGKTEKESENIGLISTKCKYIDS